MTGHPFRFDQDRFQAALDSVLRHAGAQDVDFDRAEKPALPREGAEERRVGLLCELEQALVEHLVVEGLDQRPAVGADRAFFARGLLPVHANRVEGGLGVGGDGEQRLFVDGHRVLGPPAG